MCAFTVPCDGRKKRIVHLKKQFNVVQSRRTKPCRISIKAAVDDVDSIQQGQVHRKIIVFDLNWTIRDCNTDYCDQLKRDSGIKLALNLLFILFRSTVFSHYSTQHALGENVLYSLFLPFGLVRRPTNIHLQVRVPIVQRKKSYSRSHQRRAWEYRSDINLA